LDAQLEDVKGFSLLRCSQTTLMASLPVLLLLILIT
jgi:hypothetical protein